MLKLYNTLTKKIEEFKPINHPTPLLAGQVGMYSCGPTVYDYQHIGHMRRYVGDDILIRVLKENGYKVKHVMNITDVGHLVSDSDTGEDKMEKGAKKFGLSVWDVAKKFEKQFFDSAEKLNIKRPNVVMHATDYIKDQIELIEILEEKGFIYKISDGIYFNTSKFPNYSKLFGLNKQEQKAGARIEMVEGKKHLTDFALWKFSYPQGRYFNSAWDESSNQRQMEWESPWGVGFPGWHIECSAMSIKELGPTFDIHTGGIDHIPIHHPNEIAQSEAASGKKFVNFWVHHAFLLAEGQKMSKSLGNFYTVDDVINKGFNPLALRYLYLQTHYRQEMNFTWEALEGAQIALNRLREEIIKLIQHDKITVDSKDKIRAVSGKFDEKFQETINNDLNLSEALAVVWELVKSDYPGSAKAESLFKMDQVLGLNLKESRVKNQELKIPDEVQKLVREREELRKRKKFHLADQLRNKIKKMGYKVEDLDNKAEITKI